MNNNLEYVKQKGWEFRIDNGKNGPELIIKRCPFCNDTDNHFYLNMDAGMFQCFKCKRTGTLFTLKSELGDLAQITQVSSNTEVVLTDEELQRVLKSHEDLKKDKEALLWLSDRKFSMEAVDHFKLGVEVEYGKKWLVYPYFDRFGRLRNFKRRTIGAEKDFTRRTGGDSILFNEEALNLNTESIIVCEGESDTVALWGQGFSNVVGATIGAQGVNNEWIQQLDKYRKIYLAYDNDDAGIEGAYKIGHRLGLQRCFILDLPSEIKDINDYFKAGHSAFDFKHILDTARMMDVQYVNPIEVEIQKFIRKLKESKTEEGLILPWPRLDELINKFMPGDLIVLASRPGVGKSSFAFNLLYYYARAGIPSLLFTLEMRPERILPRLAALDLGIDSREVGVIEHMSTFQEHMKGIPLYMAHKYQKPTFEFVADTIRNSVRRYGIRFIAFDNLHFLVRSAHDQTKEVSIIIQGFKLLAEEIGVPILVIARPRKSNAEVISNIDLKDSADVEADADIVILLHRKLKAEEGKDYTSQKGVFQERMMVLVSKCRYSPGGLVFLEMIDKTCTVQEEQCQSGGPIIPTIPYTKET